MSKGNLVVKTNQLNSALQNLSLPEIRIVQLAIVDARETNTGLSTDKPLRIDALRYAEMFETTRQNGYKRMKEAEETLFNRRFSYIDDKGKVVKSRWIQQVRYLDDEGAIELVFTLAVGNGISRIDGAEDFLPHTYLSKLPVWTVFTPLGFMNCWYSGKLPSGLQCLRLRILEINWVLVSKSIKL